MCCVVSSLTQLLLDPHWRTTNGFQSLIQKEWVSLGHPFANRLGHIMKPELDQSPLFLLFLDCVWQLLQQFPMAFEFTETYLTTLWDSAHISIFDTFLFNCEHDRLIAARVSYIFCRYLFQILKYVLKANDHTKFIKKKKIINSTSCLELLVFFITLKMCSHLQINVIILNIKLMQISSPWRYLVVIQETTNKKIINF